MDLQTQTDYGVQEGGSLLLHWFLDFSIIPDILNCFNSVNILLYFSL